MTSSDTILTSRLLRPGTVYQKCDETVMQPIIRNVPPPLDSSFRITLFNERAFLGDWNAHPEYELTLMQHSSGRRFVADAISPYHDGDLVLIGPWLPHTWYSDPARKTRQIGIVVHFLPNLLGDSFFDRPELKDRKSVV